MNPLADAGRVLLTDAAGRDVVALWTLGEGGAVTARGTLAAPPDAGTVEALWAGWGPSPGRRTRRTAGTGVPWLVMLDQGDLRVWMEVGRYGDAGDSRSASADGWWFARPLGAALVRSATACFEPDTGSVYVPCLVPAEGDAATAELRILWFRSRWRDEPAVPAPGAADLLQAAAWSTGPDYAPRLVLFWQDEWGKCHWGLWRRLDHEAWNLERAGPLGGGPSRAGAAADGRWRSLWLASVPGGGARAIALAAPGIGRDRPAGKEPGGAGEPLLARLDVAADGTPRYAEHGLAWRTGSGPGRLPPVAEGVGAGDADLAGWWMEGRADLVLLARRGGAGLAAVEGWLLTGSDTAWSLGAVPASAAQLQVARVAAPGAGPVVPCRVPLLGDGSGRTRPWPVPTGWLDALRSAGVALAELPGQAPAIPVLPAPSRADGVQPVPAGDPRPTPTVGTGPAPARGGQPGSAPSGGRGRPGPTLGLPARPPFPRERTTQGTRPGSALPPSEPASRPRWRIVRQRSS